MVTVRHVTAWAERTKYRTAWFFVEQSVQFMKFKEL
jgi:hypothetical protein